MSNSNWPRTRTDRARAIAIGYRNALQNVAPEAAAALDQAATAAGEGWIAVPGETGAGRMYVSRNEAARIAGVVPRTITAWVQRGRIERYVDGYLLSEIHEVLDGKRPGRNPEAVLDQADVEPSKPVLAEVITSRDWKMSGRTCFECESPRVPEEMPVDMCVQHATAVWALLNDLLHDRRRVVEAQRRIEVEKQRERPQDVVYYLEINGVVKIGTTGRLTSRMRAYPPHARLMATEPGGKAVEATRLRQFAGSLMSGREWFVMSRDLLEHIDKLRECDADNSGMVDNSVLCAIT